MRLRPEPEKSQLLMRVCLIGSVFEDKVFIVCGQGNGTGIENLEGPIGN